MLSGTRPPLTLTPCFDAAWYASPDGTLLLEPGAGTATLLDSHSFINPVWDADGRLVVVLDDGSAAVVAASGLTRIGLPVERVVVGESAVLAYTPDGELHRVPR